jgi:hypothetical protein
VAWSFTSLRLWTAQSKKRHSPLTRDELFECGPAIVAEHGLEALTTRRLAEDAGVEAVQQAAARRDARPQSP